MKESIAMNANTHRLLARLACLVAMATLGGCNPTWTKEGKPTDSSMPLPPGASTPQQAGGASQAAAAKP